MPQTIEGVELYSVNDICVITGVSYPTVLRRMNKGTMGFYTVGKTKVATRQQVVDYLKTLDFPENLIEHRLEKAGIETPSVNREAQ
jgi:excisionase family DNA binding protein